MFSYTSYFWVLGTTSFRTKEFNIMIELQLSYLQEFWMIKKNINLNWQGNENIQIKYYDYLKEKDFIKGFAPNKAKDAREKTSGLVDIGLINENRRLTNVGVELLNIVSNKNFNKNNRLNIEQDSYIYLKQLLKTSVIVNNKCIRPYVITVYLISIFDYLTEDEFTYLVPLITSLDKLNEVIEIIKLERENKRSINFFITSTLIDMPNYQNALNLFIDNEVSVELMMKIGMNRKSKSYDMPYYNLYNAIRILDENRNNMSVENLYKAVLSLNGKVATFWKQYLFVKSNKKDVNYDLLIFNTTNTFKFKKTFFELMHLFKAKATLSDYSDLNRRYFKITDTMIFKDNHIELDVIPRCYFSLIKEDLLKISFINSDNLYDFCSFDNILQIDTIKNDILYKRIKQLYGVSVSNINETSKFVEANRIERFNKLIDARFSNKILLNLLKSFINREDENIQNIVTKNADIPTIFEYIMGIIWYNISERKTNILDAFNLSLDADLLPKSHAKGGEEDLTFVYEESKYYPKHTLLLEVTLTEKTNQRRVEMEPVSRHLGEYLLLNNNKAYCLFISTYLNINVIADFRSRKYTPYYSNDGMKVINQMKIIPLDLEQLKNILLKKLNYKDLYGIFEVAYNSTDEPNIWYINNITNKIKEKL